MLKLYQFERTWGIPNLGPFCCKTETYLRMANIEYEIKVTLPSEAPKGKLPYIEDGDEVLADSGFIVMHLKTKYKDLDAGLNSEKLALSVAMQRLLEEHLYWGGGSTPAQTGWSPKKPCLAPCRPTSEN